MAKMLEGIKVLDFTMNAAGPIIGAYFADYGADVVKIEPPGGEAGRSFAYYINGMSTFSLRQGPRQARRRDRPQGPRGHRPYKERPARVRRNT